MEEELYLISHITLITGLSDRTIRNYIASGILKGEKINGIWHFTPEEVDAFIKNPAVRPSIVAKNNSVVYDFMLNDSKKEEETCVILDLPKCDIKETAEFFCYGISNGDYKDINFSFDGNYKTPRIILRGRPSDVFGLIGDYYKSSRS
ncbi:MAG: helix-turn-helix domain-containing protein [Oscillospiraceae bacterium]|nr:helix-turn-helix domain-containing protein [Oscillospiraceae bacterium]MBP1574086.1 helix-turn-helix domain-containing protein [Oscillospiraceae bacterium]MBQ8595514.1 helix-turn-helix domain-containing protein [Oscillospiraceae bacterium]